MADLSPEEQAELDQLLQVHGAALEGEDAAAAQRYREGASKLPTTNSADEWVKNPDKAEAGTILMYEPPLKAVQKALLENPDRAAALLPEQYGPQIGLPLSPEDIGGMTADHPLYRAYADDLWQQARQKAESEGKLAYRYSQAPWLQGDAAGMGTLDTLKMKLGGAVPDLLGSGEAFVLGVDNALTLGLMGRSIEANAREGTRTGNTFVGAGTPDPAAMFSGPLDQLIGDDIAKAAAAQPGGTETMGLGAPGREQLLAEYPGAALGGQILGTLNPLGASSAINRAAVGAMRPLAGAAPGVMRSAIASTAAGALGGALEQGGRDAVGAGMNALQDGQAPQMEPGWDDRAKIAAALGGAFGLGGDLLGQAASGVSQWVGGPGGRFGGLPEQFEAAGGRLTARGPEAPPAVNEVVERGRATRTKPVDVKARDLQPAIQDSVKTNVEGVEGQVRQAKQAFFSTPEGQQKLPETQTVHTALNTLREQHSEGKVIGAGKGPANWTRDIFNQELSGVSAKPVDGAIEMTVEEAENFLAPTWQRELMEKVSPKVPKQSSSGAREVDFDAPAPTEDEPFAQALKRRGIDKVYVSPRRFTAEEHEQLIQTFQNLKFDPADPAARDAKKLWHAALRDRDARPMNGKEGGWSELQQSHQRMLGIAKGERDLAAPEGDAFNPLVDYAHLREGQLPTSEALRDAAVRGGNLGELEQLRVLGMLERLQGLTSGGRGQLGRAPTGKTSLIDAGLLRSYPTLRKYGDAASSPVRAGRGGRYGATLNPIVQSLVNLRGTRLDDQPEEQSEK